MSLDKTDRNLEKLSEDDNFRQRVKNWIADNPEIFITEGFRSQERQNWLYASGRTRSGRVVTWTLNSMHTRGLAVDVAFYGKELYPSLNTPEGAEKWRKVADSAKEHGIDWGFDLWGADAPHFQDADAPHFQDAETTFDYPPNYYREIAIPAWSLEFVDIMEAAGVTTAPEEKVGDLPLYQLVGVLVKIIRYLVKSSR